jgi:hypothetical protein
MIALTNLLPSCCLGNRCLQRRERKALGVASRQEGMILAPIHLVHLAALPLHGIAVHHPSVA